MEGPTPTLLPSLLSLLVSPNRMKEDTSRKYPGGLQRNYLEEITYRDTWKFLIRRKMFGSRTSLLFIFLPKKHYTVFERVTLLLSLP